MKQTGDRVQLLDNYGESSQNNGLSMAEDQPLFESSNTETEDIILVVPCFNEELRWLPEYWREISELREVKLYFVNDGSTDGTGTLLDEFTRNSLHVLVDLPRNQGKAEAIRHGFLAAFAERPLAVGFLDADGAFPVQDVACQIQVFRKLAKRGGSPVSVWSSRVQLAGRQIERRPLRHYFARLIATGLSLRFRFTIYDTQSGMKIFPNTPTLRECMVREFDTRWFVDLEIFLRHRQNTGLELKIWEEPLLGWKDVGGSKLSKRQYLRILKDMLNLNQYRSSSNPN